MGILLFCPRSSLSLDVEADGEETSEQLYFEMKPRRRLMDQYKHPILSYWQELEPLRPEGRYIKQYRIKEMEEEVEARPAYLPFERPFSDEVEPDERIIQARDAFLESPGPLKQLEQREMRDRRRQLEMSSSPLPLDPRRRLHDYLSRKILRFWLKKQETRLDELVKHQDLREELYDLGQDETPDEFQERRVKDKRRLYEYEPLKHFRMRCYRDLMDLKTRELIRRWRDRSPAFSGMRK